MDGCVMSGCVPLGFFQLQKREINDKGGVSVSDLTQRKGSLVINS